MRKIIIIGLVTASASLGGLAFLSSRQPTNSSGQPTAVAETSPAAPINDAPPAKPVAPVQSLLNKRLHSTTEPTSLWVITNRQLPLAKGYTPDNLRSPAVNLRLAATNEQMQIRGDAAEALEKLFAGAEQAGLRMTLSSAYRSEALQAQFYNSYVARDGVAKADTYSARPGTSEHQTGLAADIIPRNDACHLEICFGDLAEGKWLAANAYKFGFTVRYPLGKEAVTGYSYEPWHIRFVGTALAAELHQSGQTMEEFFTIQ